MVFRIPRVDIRRINKFDVVYITASGGKDSTFAALEFLRNRPWITTELRLVHNNTGMRIPSAVRTLKKLQLDFEKDHKEWRESKHSKKFWLRNQGQKFLKSKTNENSKFGESNPAHFCWVELFPEVANSRKTVLDSFELIPKAQEMLAKGKFNKKVFPCCWHLKEKPFEKWIKTQQHLNSLVVLNIGPGDSFARRWFLVDKLRRNKTKFWWNKRNKVWYYYPLRDTLTGEIKDYLLKNPRYYDTQHSGCSLCPILVVMNIARKDPKRFARSKRIWMEMEGRLCK